MHGLVHPGPLLQAYQEGKELCKLVDNDMSFCKNPYPEGSTVWEYWNKGWNSYWNPDWTVKALVKSPYNPSFVFWCRHQGESPVYLDPRYNKKGLDYLKSRMVLQLGDTVRFFAGYKLRYGVIKEFFGTSAIIKDESGTNLKWLVPIEDTHKVL